MEHAFARIAGIADRQHGRVTTGQMLAAGATPRQIETWSRLGLTRRQHHGVHAIGHAAPSQLADLKAAELAGGRGAAVSHASAAWVLGLREVRPAIPAITVAGLSGRRRPALRIHRVRALPPADVVTHRGIRITAPARTLLDLAPHLTPAQLTRTAHEAWVRHRTSPDDVEDCIARTPGKPGAAKLRRALGTDATLSALEDGFLALLAAHHLPAPRTNIDLAGDKVDCHWPAIGLTIELLSFRFHNSRHGFENDVARRRRSGHEAFSWGDVFERAGATAREVRALLRR